MRTTARFRAALDTRLTSYWPLNLDLASVPPVLCSIGYGSGVFRQKGYTGPRPMVDVVLLVNDADVEEWHRENLRTNPSHYAGLPRVFGAPMAARLQRAGPGLYYNPNVRLPVRDGAGETLEAKYGVMSVKALLDDLSTWRHLYISGRMHKPSALDWHVHVGSEIRQQVEVALDANRRAALAAGLLSTEWGTAYGGRHVDKRELLEGIVKLSYYGDIRMAFAENPAKVANIVDAQEADLWTIYKPIAAEFGVLPAKDFAERQKLFNVLPKRVQDAAKMAVGRRASQDRAWEEPQFLKLALHDTVQKASFHQTAKGVVTAGIARGFQYALRKVKKRFG